jgi:hypothetical protein
MAVRLSDPLAGRPPFTPPGRFLVIISVGRLVNARAIVRLEELGQLKNHMTSSGLDHATFRLVAECLSRYYKELKCVPETLWIRHILKIASFERK